MRLLFSLYEVAKFFFGSDSELVRLVLIEFSCLAAPKNILKICEQETAAASAASAAV